MTEQEQKALEKASRSLEMARKNAAEFPEFAASRAYYTMFYAATALLLRKGLQFKTHNGVISGFGLAYARPDARWQAHHAQLINGERLRLEAARQELT